jgi:hypothetical protein
LYNPILPVAKPGYYYLKPSWYWRLKKKHHRESFLKSQRKGNILLFMYALMASSLVRGLSATAVIFLVVLIAAIVYTE